MKIANPPTPTGDSFFGGDGRPLGANGHTSTANNERVLFLANQSFNAGEIPLPNSD